MDDTDLELGQDDIETEDSPNIIGNTGKFKKDPKNPDVVGFVQRGQQMRQEQQDSMAAVLGRFDRDVLVKQLEAESSDITTFEDMQKNFDSGPRKSDNGSLVLPEVPDVEAMLARNTPENRVLYRQNYARNAATLELISDRYRDSLTYWGREKQKFMDKAEPLIAAGRGIAYGAGESIAGITNIIAGSMAAVGLGSAKVTQSIGTLGGNGNLFIENSVLMQDAIVRAYRQYEDFVDSTLSGISPTGQRTWWGRSIIGNVAPIVATVATAGGAGVAVGGRVAAQAAAKGASKAVAQRAAGMAARQVAGQVSKTTVRTYAADAMADYWMREAEGRTSPEYQQYLREKTGGNLLSDLGWGTAVGTANYYLEKMFGAEAAVQNFFGNATKGLFRTFAQRGVEEGTTEVLQDTSLDVADLVRGRITPGEFAKRLVSMETLETFVISAAIGGFAGSAEYMSSRANLAKEYKANFKQVFPNASEEQAETATKAFMDNTEKNVTSKVVQSIIADEQLKNQYGTYWEIVNNRINDLMNQSVAQGKELNLKDKSPEYQAQFAGSVAQRFVDELYSQAVLRGVPVSEVFDVTQIDVENGVMYMYGEEYGRRPIAQVGSDVTPQQWEEAQREKRIADELQRQQKEQEKQAKEAVKQARALEREQARQQAQETRQETVRNRNVARAEIREMEENQSRGIVAALHPDLPVQIMTKSELKQILRSELDNYFALQNKDQIQPIERQKRTRVRQQVIQAQTKKSLFDPKLHKDAAKKFDKARDLKMLNKQLKSNMSDEERADISKQRSALVSERAKFIRQILKDSGFKTGKLTPYENSQYFTISKDGVDYGKVRVSNHPKTTKENVIDLRVDGGTGKALQELQNEIWKRHTDKLGVPAQEQTFNQQIQEQSDLAAENERLDVENPPYEGETITVDGKERTVYNSNGDRIAKSKPALENFWRWFGDSKVVDEQGRPLVVYHGTSAKFEEFNIESPRKGVDIFGRGFYFTPHKKKAKAYGKNVMPVYLHMANPKNLTDLSQIGQDTSQLKKQGHDGIIFDRTSNKTDDLATFVAFEPSQIKSTENRGTFSPDTGNIFYQKKLAAWNPLRRSIELFDGANETSILHELSHFWLDNMMLYSRSPLAQQNPGFMAVWNNIKKYLNIDDRQERISAAQAEKYTSAYMQYIKDNKIAPIQDLGFKGMDEYIGDMAEDYFENAMHKDEEGDVYSELEELTPEIVDALQKLTTTDLSDLKNISLLYNQDKQLVQQLQETQRMVENGDITQEQKDELDAANMSAYAVNKSIENMGEQDKNTVAASENMQVLDEEQKTIENDIKKFDAEGGNTNSLQRRLNMTSLAKDINANDEALGRHDTHRDMLKVAEAADNFVNSRLEDAKLIVDGKMAEQDGLFASDLYTALENKAIQENDIDLFDFLRHSATANQLAKELGQRVAGFRNYRGNGDVDIMSALKSLDKKYEKAYDSKAKEQVQAELNALSESIAKQDALADTKLNEVLDNLECK